MKKQKAFSEDGINMGRDNRRGGRDSGRDRRGGGFDSEFRPRGQFSGGPRRQFSGPKEMHKAVCAECGQECEVPFKPSGDRPVYCRECFAKHKPQRF